MFNKVFAKSYLTQSNIDEIISHINEFDDCVWIKNKDGYYVDLNTAVCNLLQSNKETLLKYKGNVLFDKKSYNIVVENDLFVIENIKKSVINEYLYIGGKELILHTNKIPIVNSDGTCTSFLAIGSLIDDNNNINSSFISDTNENLKYNLIIENQKKKEGLLYSELSQYMKNIYNCYAINGMSLWLYCNTNKTIRKKISFGMAKYIFDDVTIPIDSLSRSKLIKNINESFYELPDQLLNFIKNTRSFNQYKSLLQYYCPTYIPIVYKSTLLGVLNIYYKKGVCHPDYSQKFKLIADRIALSLNNINLSNELISQLNKKVQVENELRRFLNIAADISIIVNTEGYIQKMSSNIPLMLGWSVKELKSVPVKNFIDSTSGSVSFKEVINSHDKKCDGGICKVFCKNNSYRIIDWYYYHESQTDEIFIIGKDITDFTMLKSKVEYLEHKSEQESFITEFLSNISHEFKTPLNIILSSVKLELNNFNSKQCPNSKLYTHLNMIKQNSFRLLRLINNLIDLTQIETNFMELHEENTNFSSFIENIVYSLSSYMKNLNRTITFTPSTDDIYLACDRKKIEKVLLNLISNAIKYTESKGKISVKLYTNKEKDKAYVSVKDNGYGIPKECSDAIFERFRQVDNIFVRRAEGSGIGLPLCKSFLQLHNGDIYINKRVRKGSEFIFYLPIRTTKNNMPSSYISKVISSEIEKFDIEFSDIYSHIS